MKRVRSVHLEAMYLGGRKIRRSVPTVLDDDEFTIFRSTKIGDCAVVELAIESGALELVDEQGKPIPYEPPVSPVP